jgi:GGDEF domain-containing protein
VVIACVACVYAVALWRLGDAHWWHHALIALLAAALQPCFGPRAAYPAFLAALLLLIGTCTVSIGHLALRYGPAALFHAMLLAYTPVLVTSGRLTLWAKGCWWAGPACSRCGWMPRAPRAGRSWPPAPPALPSAETIQQLRDINLLALGLAPAVLVYHFFTLVRRQHRAMAGLALRDPMTQLFNRRHVQATGEALVAQLLNRPQGGPSAWCCWMWTISRGSTTAGATRSATRPCGTWPTWCRARPAPRTWWPAGAREEFLLLLADTDEGQALQLAERVRSAVAEDTLEVHGQRVSLTVTIGVAQSLRAGSFAEVIRHADAALYEGKRQGRNRVVAASGVGAEVRPADLAGV